MSKNRIITIILSVILIGVLAVSALYYFVFDKYEYPYFEKIENIRIEKVDINKKMELSFVADMRFYNPSPFEVQLSGLYSEVFINEEKTTVINQKLEQLIPGNDAFVLPIRFNIPLLEKGLLKDITSILTGSWKNKSVDIRSAGTITITVAKMDMDIPFDHQKEYLLSDYLDQ